MDRRDFIKTSFFTAGSLYLGQAVSAVENVSGILQDKVSGRTVREVKLADAPALDRAGEIVNREGMPYVTLNNGVLMPLIGYGTLNLPTDECAHCVATAIGHGFRLFDTAKNYINERQIGQGIRESGIDRKELFISSKLWIGDMGYEQTKAAFQRTLNHLQLDYLDMYLIHLPFGDVHGSWRAMEELYKAGKIRAIGVSNFHPDRLMDMMINYEVRPAVNQIENHPYHQQPEIVAFNKEYGILSEAWSPLTQMRRPEILQEPMLVDIAQKYGKSVAQVILRWQSQRGVVAIPKARQEAHMIENIHLFDFTLDPQEMEQIAGLNTGKPLMFDHRNPKDVLWFYTNAGRVDPLD